MSFLGVGEWLARREQLTPDKIGLVDLATGARLTYRTLNLRARALAALLAQRYGIRQGDRVALLAANSPEYLDAFFACALLGAIFVPLNWRLAPPELATHPGIAEAAIIAQPDVKWGEVGVAVVVPRAPGSLSAEDVLAFCDGKLARYKLPRRVVFSDALPRNALGKVLKAELRARYIANTAPAVPTDPPEPPA